MIAHDVGLSAWRLRAQQTFGERVADSDFMVLGSHAFVHDSAVTNSFLEIDTDRDGCIGLAEFRSWWLSD